ncbi:hypothetical protein [Gorillibacterium sp. sgz5001074]|uniref:hypothetical protein n=1 Tax=Gorillibacterium sp. sgz5001074 TaxID=3446695 RepID=UPI003F676A66
MARNRKLMTDADFQEAMTKRIPIRVFEDDMIVDPKGLIIRFDDSVIVVQSSVSEITYHQRKKCEFFENERD